MRGLSVALTLTQAEPAARVGLVPPGRKPTPGQAVFPTTLKSFQLQQPHEDIGTVRIECARRDNMIEKSQAIPILVEAIPTFQAGWERHLVEWGEDLHYTAAGELADHLLERYRGGDYSSFPALALAVERLIVDGSSWVQEFAVIGVLEAIQNVWTNGNVDPDLFAVHLGPKGQSEWDRLNEFWSGVATPKDGTAPGASG